MEVLLESEEQMARSKDKGKDKGKRQRPNGPRHPCQQPWRSKRGGC